MTPEQHAKLKEICDRSDTLLSQIDVATAGLNKLKQHSSAGDIQLTIDGTVYHRPIGNQSWTNVGQYPGLASSHIRDYIITHITAYLQSVKKEYAELDLVEQDFK